MLPGQADFKDGNVSGPIELQGVGTTASFTNVPVLDSAIITTTANQNRVEISGNISIEQDIGTIGVPLERVDFNSSAGDRHVLKGNVYANDVAVNNTVLVVDGGTITFDAPLIASNSILVLENSTTLLNSQNSNLDNVNIQVNNTDDPEQNSNVLVDSCDVIQTGGSVTINDSAALPGSSGDEITVFATQGTGCLHSDGNVSVSGNRPFIEYSLSDDATIVRRRNVATQVVTDIINDASSSDDDIVATLEKIIAITNPDNSSQLLEEIEGILIKDSTEAGKAQLSKFINTLTSEAEISDQLSYLRSIDRRIEVYSPAAGDEDEHKIEYGAWFKPFYSQALLRKHDNIAGYSSTGFGATFGVDQRILDNLIVGLSLSLGRTHVKHKDFKAGDKTKLDNAAFSLYSRYDYNPQIFLTAIASYSNNIVKSQELHNPQLGTIAQSSYSYGTTYGELIAGYNYNLNNGITIKPLLGASYHYGGDYSYKQTGADNSNKSVKRSASHNSEIIGGARVSGNLMMDELPINLSAYGLVKHNILSDSRRNINTQLDGLVQPLPESNSKIAQTNYVAGLELNTEINGIECGLFYDLFLAPNFQMHQGSLKLTAKIEF